jgi:uncharacterized protein (TIGR02444 family)
VSPAAEAFWNFSVETYDREGVAAACLSLQDRRGLDVNILLLCCWSGRCGVRLTEADLARALDAVRGWQRAVVSSLRTARRFAKTMDAGDAAGPVQDLRARIGAIELESERIEQLLLAAAVPLPPPSAGIGSAGAAAANLAAYAGANGLAVRPEDAVDLAILLTGSFPDVPRAEARRLFDAGRW